MLPKIKKFNLVLKDFKTDNTLLKLIDKLRNLLRLVIDFYKCSMLTSDVMYLESSSDYTFYCLKNLSYKTSCL